MCCGEMLVEFGVLLVVDDLDMICVSAVSLIRKTQKVQLSKKEFKAE